MGAVAEKGMGRKGVGAEDRCADAEMGAAWRGTATWEEEDLEPPSPVTSR